MKFNNKFQNIKTMRLCKLLLGDGELSWLDTIVRWRLSEAILFLGDCFFLRKPRFAKRRNLIYLLKQSLVLPSELIITRSPRKSSLSTRSLANGCFEWALNMSLKRERGERAKGHWVYKCMTNTVWSQFDLERKSVLLPFTTLFFNFKVRNFLKLIHLLLSDHFTLIRHDCADQDANKHMPVNEAHV